ncbi:hypothetical protein K474DRAFT_700969 [Panus rudis PR-1116 ss-1]|nr:hypothetical protein K474DRAFT_734931 [Panus rudis PR-1116 ss-1]KAI0070933.1 hypothetical protein K474DRAFT_700969 [Panus rudis PR-1116 ss-1]
MRDSQAYNYHDWSSNCVKVEPTGPVDPNSAYSLLSPPCTPFSPLSATPSSVTRTSSPPRRSTSPSAFTFHKQPNLSPPDLALDTEFSSMSHPYGHWSSDSAQMHGRRQYSASPPSAGSSRRGGNGEHSAAPYGYSESYVQGEQLSSSGPRRPNSLNSMMSSSLSGAIDMTHSAHSPSSATSPTGMTWSSDPTSVPEGYTMGTAGVNQFMGAPPTPLTAESTGPFVSYDTTYPSTSGFSTPGSAQHSSGVSYMDPMYQGAQSSLIPPPVVVPTQASPSITVPMAVSPAPGVTTSAPTRRTRTPEAELRAHIRRLEQEKAAALRRVKEMEYALHLQGSQSSTAPSGLPSPMPTPTTMHSSQAFEESWRRRTEARIKHFCSLNRAGNALCAWHDSRRERRMYPPRNAPPNTLNCGCTYEEALFEDSLARHKVGSYLPGGDTVRMDPALRNPLLKLLQQRYGYRDGDFERDPITGQWVEGEGHEKWEAIAASNKRQRGDDRL